MISEPGCGEAQSAARDSFQWGKARANEKCKTRKARSYAHLRKARCPQKAVIFLFIGQEAFPKERQLSQESRKKGKRGC